MASEVEVIVNGAVGPKEEADDDVAIIEDMDMKHPLQHRWSLWYFKHEKGKDWSENQRKIASFDTIEDFWALYHHILPTSQLATGCDYSLFKEGIQPMWEDERNKRGGRWLLNIHHRKRIDQIWLEMLFCLIGEAFDEFSDEICGAVINIRNRSDKLGLWTRDCNHMDVNMEIGKIMKSRLNLGRDNTIEYQSHQESSSKSSVMQRSPYVI